MRTLILCTMLAATLAWPGAASADILLSGFWGKNFKTSVGENADGDSVRIDNHSTWGGSLAILAARGFGIEVDVGRVPDFFEPDDLDFDALGSNHVTTYMGNLLLIGGGTVRSYTSGGLGMIHSQIGDFGDDLDTTSTDFGWNAGGGLIIGSRRFAVRGDYRYFATFGGDSDDPPFEDPLQGKVSFWRGTVGLTIGF
jgi:hypothetical protein